MSAGFLNAVSDGALLSDETSLRYLTGVHLTAGTAVLGRKGRWLFLDSRYLDKGRRLLGKKWKIRALPPDNRGLIRAIAAAGFKRLAVDTAVMPAQAYRALVDSANGVASPASGVEISEAAGLADKIRVIKRPDELKILREAVRLTDELWTRLRAYLRPGISERELSAWIKIEALRLGASEMSFSPIVAAGPATCEPHAEPSDRIIGPDEPLMVDMGMRVGGYCSDFTRTVFLLRRRARPPEWFSRFHRHVLRIQDIAYRALSRGARDPARILKSINTYLVRYRLKPCYLHSLGHGVGMKIHEEPRWAPRRGRLRDGMVFTVEPGLYKSGLGGVRIEDMACLANGRLEILTQSGKEPIWRV